MGDELSLDFAWTCLSKKTAVDGYLLSQSATYDHLFHRRPYLTNLAVTILMRNFAMIVSCNPKTKALGIHLCDLADLAWCSAILQGRLPLCRANPERNIADVVKRRYSGGINSCLATQSCDPYYFSGNQPPCLPRITVYCIF